MLCPLSAYTNPAASYVPYPPLNSSLPTVEPLSILLSYWGIWESDDLFDAQIYVRFRWVGLDCLVACILLIFMKILILPHFNHLGDTWFSENSKKKTMMLNKIFKSIFLFPFIFSFIISSFSIFFLSHFISNFSKVKHSLFQLTFLLCMTSLAGNDKGMKLRVGLGNLSQNLLRIKIFILIAFGCLNDLKLVLLKEKKT